MQITEQKLQEYISLLTGEMKEKYDFFRNLLLEYNQKYNLTAITEEKDVFYKHFLDSVAGESAFPREKHVVEVGSGAGFPSIPLKLFRDDLRFTLVESIGKKCEFLQVAVDKLGLCGVTVRQMRAEDAGRDPLMRETFDVCCARAVARLNTLAEYCLPLVKKGGLWIAYKGRAEEEVSEGKKAIALLGGGRTECLCYELPEGYGERTLVCVEKSKNTPEKYPRGNGKERSKPIV